ncbi:MAG: N(4)-(Beta-N-acetylglucosaminyl)-L-asparaginase [Anaerolineales bacterium]|nr:N(4)-(Beta-N-acetylglucosaminyl)-L-asparaginase [Anaerolineales bacterium]
MIIVTSEYGDVGLPAAMQDLHDGGSALDAVETGTRIVESNPEDHTVGFSGLPNLLGEVELDASLMDGRTLRAGAVGSLRGYEHAISVARKVMEELPHVLIVGEGAARFATEMGFEKRNLLTPEADRIWRERLEAEVPAERRGELRYREKMRELARLAVDPELASETVNFLALDRHGDIASAVSTSGWAWKYPGRLGDSPIIGAGGYADNRYGAAACTGRGEMAICLGTARSVIVYMKMGMSVEEACVEAMNDFEALQDPYAGGISIRAIDRDGRPAGASNREDRFLWYWQDDVDGPAKLPLVYVDTGH